MTFLAQVIGLAREKPGFFGTKRTVVSLQGIDGDDRKAQITINDPFATVYELGRRVAWDPDPSVLLINEQNWLCIRKPDGSVRQALLCREDLANDDWVIGG